MSAEKWRKENIFCGLFMWKYKQWKMVLQCLNKDGVQISLSISYQFRVRPKKLGEIILQFKDYDGFKSVLKPIGKCYTYKSTITMYFYIYINYLNFSHLIVKVTARGESVHPSIFPWTTCIWLF